MPPKKGQRNVRAADEDAELQEAIRVSQTLQKEEEERKRALEAEVRRRIQEEEEMRKEQERLEEEEKRAIEEAKQKAKAEQLLTEKKKRLEEQVQKKLVAEKQKEEQRKADAAARRAQEDEKIIKLEIPEAPPAPQIDLLGGLTDDEEGESFDIFDDAPRQVAKPQQRQQALDRSDSSSVREGANHHRDIAQRGPVDWAADEFFDNFISNVTVKKSTKNDGTYLFGTRIIRLQEVRGELIVSISPKNQMSLSDFVAKFEKVENLKAKGLQAAVTMCQMLSTPKSKAVTVK